MKSTTKQKNFPLWIINRTKNAERQHMPVRENERKWDPENGNIINGLKCEKDRKNTHI